MSYSMAYRSYLSTDICETNVSLNMYTSKDLLILGAQGSCDLMDFFNTEPVGGLLSFLNKL